MTTSKELYAEARKLDDRSAELKKQAHELHITEQRARPLDDRLVYAAYARCPCGAGMAYDPAADEGVHGHWDCSAIILGTADQAVKHEAKLPFAFYEIKSENQPSANGATTRPKKEEPAA